MRKLLVFAALIFTWSLAAVEGVLNEHRVKFGEAELIINAAGEVQMLLNGKPFIKKDHVSVSQNGKFLYSTEWTREPVVLDFNEENGVFTAVITYKKEGVPGYRKTITFKDGELTIENEFTEKIPSTMKAGFTMLLDPAFPLGSTFSSDRTPDGKIEANPQKMNWNLSTRFSGLNFPESNISIQCQPSSWHFHDLRKHGSANVRGYMLGPNLPGKSVIKIRWKELAASANFFPGDTSFETGLGFWMPQGKWKLDDSTAKFGQKSLKLSAPYGSSLICDNLSSGGIALDKDTYTFSVWLKGEIENQPVKLRFIRGTWHRIERRVNVGTQWQRYQITLPASFFAADQEIWYITFDAESSQKALWLDGVQLVKGSNPENYSAPEFACSFNAPNPGNIFIKGENKFFTCGFSSATARSFKATAVIHSLCPEKEFSRATADVTIEPGKVTRLPIGQVPGELGYYRYTVSFSDPSIPPQTTYFIVAAPAIPCEKFFLGSRVENSLTELEILHLLGGEWVSISTRATSWDRAEPEKGRYDMSLFRRADISVNYALSRNLVVRLGCSGTPTWATSAPKDAKVPRNYPPRDFADLENFATYLANYFKGRVFWYELLGESDLSWRATQNWDDQTAARHVANYTKHFAIGARRALPDVRISGCGISSAAAMNFLQMVLPQCHEYLYSVDMHPYTGNRSIGPRGKWTEPENCAIKESLQRTRRVLDGINPAIRHGNGELGFAMDKTVSCDSTYANTFAAIVQRAILLSKAGGAEIVNWYCTYNNDEPPLRFRYGFLRDGSNYTPWPTAATFAQCARILKDARMISEDLLANAISEYCFINPRNGVITLWNSKSEKSIEVTLTSPVDGLEVQNMFGHPLARPDKNGKVTFTVSRHPVHLEFAAEDMDKVKAALRQAEFSVPPVEITIAPGDSRNLKITIANSIFLPFNGTAEVTVTGENINETVTRPVPRIPINGKVDLMIPFTGSGRFQIAVTVTSDRGVKVSGNQLLEIMRVRRQAPGQPMDMSQAVFLGLDALRPVDIANAQIYRGDADISARFSASYDAEYLYLGFDVTDDKHYPGPTANLAYNGDSIQFATHGQSFCLPGASYGKDTAEYNFCMIGNRGQWSSSWQPEVCQDTDKIKCEVVRENNKTIYRVALPWKALGMSTPGNGGVFRGGFVVFETDNTNETLRWLEFSGGVAGGKSVYLFKYFILED